MKFKARYVIIPLCSLPALFLLVLGTLHFRRMVLVDEYVNKLASAVQDGDILCRLGDRTWSLYFKGLSPQDKRFSHLGIVHIREGGIMVINAEGLTFKGRDMVAGISLREFIKPGRILGLYRAKGIAGEKIAEAALEMLGRPFDWGFDLRDQDRVYCTELLYAALKTTAPELKLLTVNKFGRDIVPLEAVSTSPLFTEILLLE
jgi:hypothetical protein